MSREAKYLLIAVIVCCTLTFAAIAYSAEEIVTSVDAAGSVALEVSSMNDSIGHIHSRDQYALDIWAPGGDTAIKHYISGPVTELQVTHQTDMPLMRLQERIGHSERSGEQCRFDAVGSQFIVESVEISTINDEIGYEVESPSGIGTAKVSAGTLAITHVPAQDEEPAVSGSARTSFSIEVADWRNLFVSRSTPFDPLADISDDIGMKGLCAWPVEDRDVELWCPFGEQGAWGREQGAGSREHGGGDE